MQLHLAETPPAALAQAAAGQLAHMAARRGVARRVDAAPALAPLRADEEKIRRVLVNLIANALQHSSRGGEVVVKVARADGGVRFEVRDTGCGIAPDAFERIFQKYGQAGGRKVARASTGLGLPFARLAIEAHGGRISVESEIGSGTTFVVALPAKPA